MTISVGIVPKSVRTALTLPSVRSNPTSPSPRRSSVPIPRMAEAISSAMSGSKVDMTWGALSMRVTFISRTQPKASAISRPIYPPPMTTTRSGLTVST